MCLSVALGSVVNRKLKLFEPLAVLPIGLSVLIGTSMSLKFDNEYKMHLLKKMNFPIKFI